jgi:signal transduction histidine kinase
VRSLVPIALAAALAALGSEPARASWADPGAGRPVARVFRAEDHGSEARNYCVVRDARGRLLVGSDAIRVFDGRSWSRIGLEAEAAVTAFDLGSDGRVWVVASGDFGYLEEDETGAYRFRSLRAQAPAGASRAGWGVFREGDATLFVMQDALLVWDGRRMEAFPLPNEQRLFSFRFRGGVAIGQDAVLWLWKAGRMERVDMGGLAGVSWGVSCRDGSELVRARAGLFRLTPAGAVSVPRVLTEGMHQSLEVAAVRLSDGLVCVSSATGGLFFLTDEGRIVGQLGRDDGLPSQMYFGLFLDHEDGLWVAAANAVLRLDARNLVSRFDAGNGLDGGAVRLVVPASRATIALADEGVREWVPAGPSGAHFIPWTGPQSLYFDACEWSDESLLLTGLRVLVLDRAGHEPVRLRVPVSAGRIVRVPDRPDAVLVASGNSGIEVEVGSGLTERGRVVSGAPGDIADMAFDRTGRLWCALDGAGVFGIDRVVADGDGAGLGPVDVGLAQMDNPRLFALAGSVYACNDAEVWRLPQRDEARPRRELDGVGLPAAERSGAADLWAIARRGGDTRLVRLALGADGALVAAPVACPGLETIGSVNTMARDAAGRTLWIGGMQGALRVDLSEPRFEPPPPAPRLVRVERRVGDGPAVALPLAGGIAVGFDGAAAFAFDLRDDSDVLGSGARLEARLAGRDAEWTAAGNLRTYAGLREGSYEMQVRAVDVAGRVGPVSSYAFTVLPPWYRTGWGYLGFFVAGLATIAGSAQLWVLRIKRRNIRLETLVKLRTEELTRAITARTAFLANMGHEIRNPLNGVVGLVEMLRQNDVSPDKRSEILARLGACSEQLVSVVEDVLEFSRVDAGRIAVRPQPFVLREPVEAAVGIFRAAEPGRIVAIEASPADLARRVVGDPTRIRQVLVNYIANALKFAPTSPVTVVVERRGESDVFSVADRGPGIPRDEQARLFMRFTRGTFAQREGIPGTGLGLAACKAYAEAMGGEVWVESERGQGATFFLRVPLRPAVEGEMLPAVIVPDIMAGRRALVVDDHEFNRVVLSDLLAHMGAAPSAVADAAKARETLAAGGFDVVFADFDLPGETGADLARWIRAEAPAGRDVPIVATSAFEVDEIRKRCFDAGMDAFVAKPVTRHKVAEAMSRIETIRTGGAGLEPAPGAAQPAPGAGFLDLLSDGDPVRRKELEKAAWREVLAEAASALRLARRGKLPETGRHAHKLTSAALMLALSEVVAVSRELTGAARAGDGPAVAKAAAALRRAVFEARRQVRGGR